MARPRNTDLRKRLNARFLELYPDLITKSATVDAVANEFAMNPRTVLYYLSDPNAKSRRPYSEHIKKRVALMNLEEIKAYALRIGRDWRRLYQIMLQHRKAAALNTEPLDAKAKRKADLMMFKVFNFSFHADLHAFDLTLDEVREAKKALQAEWGLTLAAPNYLVHKAGNRRYDLSYEEQVLIVKHPRHFVITNAERIGQNWQPYDESKTSMEMLGLEDFSKNIPRGK